VTGRRASGVGEIAAYFLRLGVVGFGGPNAHIAIMHQDLVRTRRWVEERRFLDIVGATNLIPGPNSSEIAMHLGYERAGRLGGLVAGLCFAAPAFAIVVALSALYAHSGSTAIRTDLLAALQPAALAAITIALWKLRAGVLGGAVRPVVTATGLVLTLALPSFAPLVILAGGVAGLAAHRAANRDSGANVVVPVVLVLAVAGAEAAGLPTLGWVFLRTGVLLFGGGLVLVPLLEPEVVGRGWLTRREFLDGIAIGQSTPGPIVMTAAFVGYVVDGLPGAAVAAAAIYLPSFTAVLFVSGPLLARFKDDPNVRAFVEAVSATAIGSIAASSLLLAPSALGTPVRAVIGVLAAAALVNKVAVVWVMLGAAALGVAAGLARLT
jgi:chromate transporter